MSETEIKTVRVTSSSKEQGAFVVINESDFNKKTMALYGGPAEKVKPVLEPVVEPVVKTDAWS